MSSKGTGHSSRGKHSSVSASISNIFDSDFPLTLEPKIEKLSFGSNYAIQGIPLTETVTFHNGSDHTYKLKIIPIESNKYELTANEEKVVLKKGERIQIEIQLLFKHYQAMGLSGQVQFSCQKKSIIKSEPVKRALRFQLEGVVPSYNEKDLTQVSDEEQFRIGNCTGKLCTVKKENVIAFKYNCSDKYEKQDYNFILDVYRDIHHASIVGMVGLVLSSHTVLIDGDTYIDLESQMKKEKLPIPFLLRCCSDLATALNYLSRLNIIHRNVKPSKIRLVHHDITNEGKCTAKLHDLTTIYKLKKGETIKKSPGTYQYMAPEVMEMKEHGLKIDVFSFAMTLYHIFTNEIPYAGMDNTLIQQKVVSGERLPLDLPSIPKGIAEIIERCWDEDPSSRPNWDAISSKLNEVIKDYTQF